jgi:hypothetical protein
MVACSEKKTHRFDDRSVILSGFAEEFASASSARVLSAWV